MRWLRRISQTLVFLVFVFLFINTEYKDNDVLEYAVNIFLRLDPLVAGAAVISGRALIDLVWPALIVVALTMLLGRFFCGWVCPLGSTLDFTSATVFRGVKKRPGAPDGWKRYKYYLLVLLLASSLFTLQPVFLFDPISIIIRSFTVAFYPAFNLAAEVGLGGLYGTPVDGLSEPVYGFLKTHVLSFDQQYFRNAGLVALIFIVILGLEYVQRRFWCRNLCPLGALFGLLGRFGLVRRRVDEPDCTSCGRCERGCRMGAIGEDFVTTSQPECIDCMDCRAVCPERVITFSGPVKPNTVGTDLTRRGLAYSFGLGALAAPVLLTESHVKAPYPFLVRPPGALPEDEFLARCTRCGECMRVCIANGLQPSVFEAGVAGLWSPVLVSRIGYCEYNCTLCGQVCPTGAIKRLTLKEKHETKLGLAEFDKNHCLPHRGESECIVCEEHCPTADKAIKFREETTLMNDGTVKVLKKPYIVDRLCVGCGICENKCPLADRPAVYVTSRGESRSGGGFFI